MDSKAYRSPSSSNTAEKGDGQSSSKQAACLNCRKSKTRCLRNAGEPRCKKCSQTEAECIVPEYRVGRKKGIKNKRDGLEKAVYRIEQAIKRQKSGNQSDDGQVQQLEGLLNDAQQYLPQKSPQENEHNFQLGEGSSSSQQLPRINSIVQSIPAPNASDSNADDFSVHDAENPLQLLARASDLSVPTNSSNDVPRISSSLPISRLGIVEAKDLRDFFGPFRPSLDNGEEIDPIEMGLVTQEETRELFNYFHKHLSHTRWGLDPILHTPHFVQKHSVFLFTSILAASALFIPSAGALSKRLSAHSKSLARLIFANGNRSPEIVLAFMINIPWMAPGKHWSDDETCSYMAMALTIALDSSLDKLIVPSPSDIQGGVSKGRAQSECITARMALDMDGFADVDPASDYGRRLLRRRERIWLALFVLDRGVCLARGRSFIVPVTPLIDTCDDWHRSSIADVWDGSIISSTVLRRDLVNLITSVKDSCGNERTQNISGRIIVQSLQQMIDGFFTQWYSTWAFTTTPTTSANSPSIPPYVEILVTHGRLSIYSSVINHPTAPLAVKRFFRAAGLSSSLNVMRAAVQGENKLQSMPNNTCIMISFAACFAVYLSTIGKGSLAPSVRVLIEESAGVLERIGNITPHRKGTSALYGRHLRVVVGSLLSTPAPRPPRSSEIQQAAAGFTHPHPRPQHNTHLAHTPTQPLMYTPQQQQASIPELLQFSAMSDNQINEAINNAGEEFDLEWAGLQDGSLEGLGMGMDRRGLGLDWLNWFNVDVNEGASGGMGGIGM